ncbi:MAG TPA: HlyD family efflux transporter periplasmic adaptor subunit [Gemmataceae bacterium]|nr:HlyD family efflux transporter periplasmic adaptor subunit [Gemmataceae bacterium]
MKKLLLLLVLLGLALAGAAYVYRHPALIEGFSTPAEPPTLETSAVVRGDLLETVTASAVVQPRETLVISTDQTGRVVKLLHDVNDVVKPGDVLLQLDDQVQRQKLKQAEAVVKTARAAVASTGASVDEARTARDAAQVELDRAKDTLAKGSGSQSLVNKAEAEFKLMNQKVRTAEAFVDTAKAKLNEAQQQYDFAKLGVDLTVVRVPAVDHSVARNTRGDDRLLGRVIPADQAEGAAQEYTILERKVVLNQLVGPPASAQLFVLSPNLKQLELRGQVAEGDIYRVAKGQDVYFTVSAYEDHYFTGKVKEIKPMPAVVTGTTYYTVVIAVDDGPQQDGKRLQPGMTTASLDIVTNRQRGADGQGVWLVPEAAVSFALEKEYRAPEDKDKPPANEADLKYVWVTEGDNPHAAKFMPIQAGTTGKILDKGGKGLRSENYTVVQGWGDKDHPVQLTGREAPFRVVTGAQPGKKGGLFPKVPSLIK